MRSKIYCQTQGELARYLGELATYFERFGLIPGETGPVALPQNGVVRIRFDENGEKSMISITIDWETGGVPLCPTRKNYRRN